MTGSPGGTFGLMVSPILEGHFSNLQSHTEDASVKAPLAVPLILANPPVPFHFGKCEHFGAIHINRIANGTRRTNKNLGKDSNLLWRRAPERT